MSYTKDDYQKEIDEWQNKNYDVMYFWNKKPIYITRKKYLNKKP
jgi:hypothetical protein